MGVRDDVIGVTPVVYVAYHLEQRGPGGPNAVEVLGENGPTWVLIGSGSALGGNLRKEVLDPRLPEINVWKTIQDSHVVLEGNL